MSGDRTDELLEEEMDQCFRALLQVEAITEEEMDYLIKNNYQDLDYELCLALIVDRILEKIKEGRLKRWDFDLWDVRWKGLDGRRAGAEIYSPLQSKKIAKKRGILTKIIRVYRWRCCKEVDNMLKRLAQAETYVEMAQIKNEAISKGILINGGRKLSHNHSFIHSKRFFEAYHNKLYRLVSGRA